MNKETQSIIRNLQNILSGDPWYGKPLFVLFDGVNPSQATIKPNDKGHSLNELLYHMIAWAEFVLNYLAENKPIEGFENLDWRILDPNEDDWQKGVSHFKTVNSRIMDHLNTKEDAFLKEMVPGTKYNFRFLLNGLIQHNIYHAGQIAYITRLME
jgi:hypothetical protein